MKLSSLKKIINKIVQESIKEKKIGFNRGPEYSEETEDLLNDFAKSTEMINKELSKKVVSNDDPKVQEILNILDDNVNPEFIEDLETVYNLIQELPDKPTETPKVGFREGKKKGLDGKACWDGYKLQGTKMKGGKRVDNCVPIKESETDNLKKIKDIIKKTLEKEGGASGLKPLEKATDMSTKDLEQTLDTMDNVKKHQHDDYILTPIEEDLTIQEVLDMEVIDENITEAKYKGKTVQLNKPTRGDSKKFKVYVNSGKKNADGSIKVKKVNFGQKGMSIKKNNPKRRKAFRARHNCDNPGPKTMARYWSCKKW